MSTLFFVVSDETNTYRIFGIPRCISANYSNSFTKINLIKKKKLLRGENRQKNDKMRLKQGYTVSQ